MDPSLQTTTATPPPVEKPNMDLEWGTEADFETPLQETQTQAQPEKPAPQQPEVPAAPEKPESPKNLRQAVEASKKEAAEARKRAEELEAQLADYDDLKGRSTEWETQLKTTAEERDALRERAKKVDEDYAFQEREFPAGELPALKQIQDEARLRLESVLMTAFDTDNELNQEALNSVTNHLYGDGETMARYRKANAAGKGAEFAEVLATALGTQFEVEINPNVIRTAMKTLDNFTQKYASAYTAEQQKWNESQEQRFNERKAEFDRLAGPAFRKDENFIRENPHHPVSVMWTAMDHLPKAEQAKLSEMIKEAGKAAQAMYYGAKPGQDISAKEAELFRKVNNPRHVKQMAVMGVSAGPQLAAQNLVIQSLTKQLSAAGGMVPVNKTAPAPVATVKARGTDDELTGMNWGD